MGKHSSASNRPISAPKEVNPLWRGVGCLMIAIVPIFSFGLGYITLDIAKEQGWPVPYELFLTPTMPKIFYASTPLANILGPLFAIQGLYGYILFTAVYIFVVGGAISAIYSILYRAVSPSRYGPTDVPPENRKAKKSR